MNASQLEILFKAHYVNLYQFAKSMLYDDDESRDVVSDVFAKVYSDGINLDATTAHNYLATAVRNRCLNIIKQKTLQERTKRLFLLDYTETDEDEGTDTLSELAAFIRNNIHGTAEKVMRMKYITGMESKDIAQRLGISTVAVYKHLAHSMETIRTNFKKQS